MLLSTDSALASRALLIVCEMYFKKLDILCIARCKPKIQILSGIPTPNSRKRREILDKVECKQSSKNAVKFTVVVILFARVDNDDRTDIKTVYGHCLLRRSRFVEFNEDAIEDLSGHIH